MNRWHTLGVIGMVGLYAALVIGTADCLFVQAVEPGHVRHTPVHAGHSPLCAWVCQTNPPETICVASPPAADVACVVMQPRPNVAPQVILIPAISRSRAPPASPTAGIGFNVTRSSA